MPAKGFSALILALSLATGGCRADPEPRPAHAPALGLMSSLPLYWGEGGAEFGAVLGNSETGWVRPALEQRFRLTPLDALDAEGLRDLRFLLLAQPRPLAPAENVALDDWVRRGGRLLLFADPALTRHSRFPIGDPRRPQDSALLSPILARWGLELLFDDAQPPGPRTIEAGSAPLVVDLAGSLRPTARSSCVIEGNGVVAQCRIGRGRVIVVGDAAVFDAQEHSAMLDALLARAFD